MGIDIVNNKLMNSFIKGNIVFKITSVKNFIIKDVSVATSFEDYKNKLNSHLYNPLLYTCNMYLRLAYLFGCLNYEPLRTRDESFTFWWRVIGQDEWKVWFKVQPYQDNLVDEMNIQYI